jgi:hypothetical protein
MATCPSWLSFASMQTSRWCHVPPSIPTGTTPEFWGPNPKTIHRWFWGPNHSTCVAIVLDRLTIKSSSASTWLAHPLSWLGQHGHSHILLYLSMTLGVSHPWSTTRLLGSLSPSLIIHPSPLPVHQHGPAWPSPSPLTTVSELHTCAPQAKRHVAQPNSHLGYFNNSTLDAILRWQSLITHRTTRAHINLVFACIVFSTLE